VEIPPEYAPHPDQIPAFVTNDEELRRFRLCFGIGRGICGRNDPIFVAELFHGDLPTDDAPEAEAGRSLLDE
jgi:hypothetical protein